MFLDVRLANLRFRGATASASLGADRSIIYHIAGHLYSHATYAEKKKVQTVTPMTLYPLPEATLDLPPAATLDLPPEASLALPVKFPPLLPTHCPSSSLAVGPPYFGPEEDAYSCSKDGYPL